MIVQLKQVYFFELLLGTWQMQLGLFFMEAICFYAYPNNVYNMDKTLDLNVHKLRLIFIFNHLCCFIYMLFINKENFKYPLIRETISLILPLSNMYNFAFLAEIFQSMACVYFFEAVDPDAFSGENSAASATVYIALLAEMNYFVACVFTTIFFF